MDEENAIEDLQRCRRDRQILLDFVLASGLIKKVVMPPCAVTLDDLDLDQISVDYVLNCARKGGMLDLSEAIRDHHGLTGFLQMNNSGSGEEFLVTNLDSSGPPPKRAPPPVSASRPPPVYTAPAVIAPTPIPTPSLTKTNVSRSGSLESSQARGLTGYGIEGAGGRPFGRQED